MPAKWASLFTLYRAWTVSATALWHLSFLNAVSLGKRAQNNLYPVFFCICLVPARLQQAFLRLPLALSSVGDSTHTRWDPRCGAWVWLPRLLWDSSWEFWWFLSSSLVFSLSVFFKLILCLIGVLVTSEWNVSNPILNLSLGKRYSGEK